MRPIFQQHNLTWASNQARTDDTQTKVCIQSIDNWRHCFLLFITFVGLAAFNFDVLLSKVCNEALVVLDNYLNLVQISKTNASQRIDFILQAHHCKDIQKNIMEAWNFTKNKFHQRCFDNYWNVSEQIFLRTVPDRYF